MVLSACGSENQLAADAEAVCNAFDPAHLKREHEGMWLSDVEKAIYDQLATDIKTDQVKAVIAGRVAISDYDEVYPYIKGGMKDATGASWDCPDMSSFYDIDFVPATSAAQETGSALEIKQVDGLVFLIENVEIDFSDTERAAAEIQDHFGAPKTVTIRLSGAGQDEMPQVLKVMTEIGVENVKMVTPAG